MHIGGALLFLFFLVLFLEVLFFFLAFLFFFDLTLFVFLVVEVVGDRIQMDGMGLRDLELRFTLRTTQDFAFLDFVLIHIYFGATIGAANHGTILRAKFTGRDPKNRDRHRILSGAQGNA